MCIRAGEFTKKNLYHGKNRVFGPKNAQKKFGSPMPNFPPPQFGFTYLNKLGTALIHVTQIQEGENWAQDSQIFWRHFLDQKLDFGRGTNFFLEIHPP